jgi:hypothetical protein
MAWDSAPDNDAGNFNNASHWTSPTLGPPVVPSGTATFVAGSTTRDITINAATPLDGMTLNQDAGAFTFTNHATLTFGGSGIVVGSAPAPRS